MSYTAAVTILLNEDGVEESTMMKSHCLRYQGEFMGMFFDKADALIIKLSSNHVQTLIADGIGLAFNYTKRPFKEWVMIPIEFADQYEHFLFEALTYAKHKASR